MIKLIGIIIVVGIILFMIKFDYKIYKYLTKGDKIHLAIISAINFALILVMVYLEWNSYKIINNYGLYLYITITFFNALVWFTLSQFNKPEYIVYKISTMGLSALFFPVLILCDFK